MLNLNSQEMIFAVGLFATAALLVYGFAGLVARTSSDPLSRRLRPAGAGEAPVSAEPRPQLSSAMGKLGQAAARPFMPRDLANQSALRQKLIRAGIYSASASQMIIGLKAILMFVGAMLGAAAGLHFGGFTPWVTGYVGAAAGYLSPMLWLNMRISKRTRLLDQALPDALDLMVICVESGLTIDAAVQRVGDEIALAHPEITQEFGITHMETRIGVPRIEALKNLGHRTGCASLQSLAAMLVQTERFVTSVAQALRVHAESLRCKRQYAAEERAAKTTVKLAFPVVLFIFPSLLIVLGGPALILFFKSPLFIKQ